MEERNGDLVFERMANALYSYVNEKCCSSNIERYIIGSYSNNERKKLKNIFNYKRYFSYRIPLFFSLDFYQNSQINKILLNEMNTIKIKPDTDIKIICLIIYAIIQMRKNFLDKILVCSPSNLAADMMASLLIDMVECGKKLNILRIYAKNQEIVDRSQKLDFISFHKILAKSKIKKNTSRRNAKKGIIKKNDIIISTCVNSYCDELINIPFPFVIIVDANKASESESLIPITLQAKYVLLISYRESDSEEGSLYHRMKQIYPQNHFEL